MGSFHMAGKLKCLHRNDQEAGTVPLKGESQSLELLIKTVWEPNRQGESTHDV